MGDIRKRLPSTSLALIMDRSTRQIGDDAEALARQYLEQHGLRFVANNVSCRFGEIDLVMRDAEMLVFVEVRYRKHGQFGGAASTITYHKQQRLIRTALWYLQRHEPNGSGRFDVVAIDSVIKNRDNDQADNINWIRDAFQAT